MSGVNTDLQHERKITGNDKYIGNYNTLLVFFT